MPKVQSVKESSEEALAIAPPVNKINSRRKKAVEVHHVTTQWAQEVAVEKPPSRQSRKKAQAEEVEIDDGDSSDDLEDLPEELANFLRERGEEAGDIIMEVRLVDRKPGSIVSPREGLYIGSYPFNVGTYLEDLSLYCAESGKVCEFVVRLKQDGQYLPKGTLKDVRVVGASVERKIEAGVIARPQQSSTVSVSNGTPSTMQMVQHEAPKSLTEQVAELATIVGTLREAGIVPKVHQQQQQAIQQQPQEMSEETILTRALMTGREAQEKVANGLLGKIFGNGAVANETPWWGEVVADFVRTIAPGARDLLSVFAQAQQVKLNQSQQVIEQANGNGHSHAEPLVQLPPEPIPPPMSEMPQQESTPEDLLFNKILWLCIRRKMYTPSAAAKNVLAYVSEIETQSGAQVFTGAMESFLDTDADVLLAGVVEFYPMAAPLAQQPDVPHWITELQAEIRKEWEQDGNQDTAV
jgi:hypothetical protein